MSFLRSLIITAIIVFAGVHFGGNYIVAEQLKNWLGVSVDVERVKWGFSSHRFMAKNVRLHNPAGYKKPNLAVISSIQADYDPSQLRQGLIKLTHLEVMIDEVYLERKSLAEPNILELSPLRAMLGKDLERSRKNFLPIQFQIEKTKIEIGKVIFETQLGNDQVTENRKVESPSTELTELTTPDSVVVYAAMLVLKSAGWQTLLPTRTEVKQEVQNQMNLWLDQMRQKAQALQVQVNQVIDEKLKKTA